MSNTGFPIVLDGALQADRDLCVSMLGGVFQFGEGLFETFSVIDGMPLFLGPHVSRLQSSARALGFGEAPDEDAWRRDLAVSLTWASLPFGR